MPAKDFWRCMIKVRLETNYRGIVRPANTRRQFGVLVGKIYDILIGVVNKELATKTYQNRTGKLAGGTEARLYTYSSDSFKIEVQQGAEYGRFVQARGYSKFDSLVRVAEARIDKLVQRFLVK